jgi:hypothetical protein
MKTIFGVMTIVLLSASVFATAGKKPTTRIPNGVDLDLDQRFVCKNDQSDFIYVVNVSDGEIDTFINDHQLANGVQEPIKQAKNLHVVKDIEIVPNTGKEIISYTLSKRIYTTSMGDILRPIVEIEMEKSSENSMVAHADMKIMDVKPSDTNDIDDNISCRGRKKN